MHCFCCFFLRCLIYTLHKIRENRKYNVKIQFVFFFLYLHTHIPIQRHELIVTTEITESIVHLVQNCANKLEMDFKCWDKFVFVFQVYGIFYIKVISYKTMHGPL